MVTKQGQIGSCEGIPIFSIVWPAPFYRGSSAPALPRLAVTGPEAIDPAGPGRAVQFNCDAIYGVHLDTGSADFIQSSFMPPTFTGAAVPRVLIGLPCVHVTGASVADAEF